MTLRRSAFLADHLALAAGEVGEEVVEGLQDRGLEELLLGLEGPEEQRLGDAGAARDLLRRGAGVPALGKALAGGPEQQPADLLAGAPAASLGAGLDRHTAILASGH